MHADLIPVDPGELAAAEYAGRGELQEEFLQVEVGDRDLEFELGAGVARVQHEAVARPGAVDRDDARRSALRERHAPGLALILPHRIGPQSVLEPPL